MAPRSYHDRGPNFGVASTVYTGVATSATSAAARNAIDTARRLAPGTRRTIGRAVTILSAKRPIAPITVRNTIHRAISRVGVAAVSEIDGITNCGAGPGFG